MTTDRTLVEDLKVAAKHVNPNSHVDPDGLLLLRALAELKRREWRPIEEAPPSENFLIFTEEAQRQGGVGSYHQDSKITISSMWRINQMDSFDRRYIKRFMRLPEPPTPESAP